MTGDTPVTFERVTAIEAESPTLIEGLPGHGLVASITVQQIVEQLALDHYGSIRSAAFPPVASYEDGRIRDLVRVYAGADPAVMTLQSDVALPYEAFAPLSRCVLEDLAAEFERAIFLAGAPAQTEEDIGTIRAIATTDDLEAELVDNGIELVDGAGVIGGITGALAADCYHAGVPAAVLVVRSLPNIPDPVAAQSVIENALEPLVDFEVDTTALEEQADEIRQQLQRVADQHRQVAERSGGESAQRGMFQ